MGPCGPRGGRVVSAVETGAKALAAIFASEDVVAVHVRAYSLDAEMFEKEETAETETRLGYGDAAAPAPRAVPREGTRLGLPIVDPERAPDAPWSDQIVSLTLKLRAALGQVLERPFAVQLIAMWERIAGRHAD